MPVADPKVETVVFCFGFKPPAEIMIATKMPTAIKAY
jgi:hypothetical protein